MNKESLTPSQIATLQAKAMELQRIALEHTAMVRTIALAGERLGIDRRGRPLCDWLAQVLQALMFRECPKCKGFVLADVPVCGSEAKAN